jgi:hypothetical protein
VAENHQNIKEGQALPKPENLDFFVETSEQATENSPKSELEQLTTDLAKCRSELRAVETALEEIPPDTIRAAERLAHARQLVGSESSDLGSIQSDEQTIQNLMDEQWALTERMKQLNQQLEKQERIEEIKNKTHEVTSTFKNLMAERFGAEDTSVERLDFHTSEHLELVASNMRKTLEIFLDEDPLLFKDLVGSDDPEIIRTTVLSLSDTIAYSHDSIQRGLTGWAFRRRLRGFEPTGADLDPKVKEEWNAEHPDDPTEVGNERASFNELKEIVAQVDPEQTVFTPKMLDAIEEAVGASYVVFDPEAIVRQPTLTGSFEITTWALANSDLRGHLGIAKTEKRLRRESRERNPEPTESSPIYQGDFARFGNAEFRELHPQMPAHIELVLQDPKKRMEAAKQRVLETSQLPMGTLTEDLVVQNELKRVLREGKAVAMKEYEEIKDEKEALVQEMLGWWFNQSKFPLGQKKLFENSLSELKKNKLANSPAGEKIAQRLQTELFVNFDENAREALEYYHQMEAEFGAEGYMEKYQELAAQEEKIKQQIKEVENQPSEVQAQGLTVVAKARAESRLKEIAQQIRGLTNQRRKKIDNLTPNDLRRLVTAMGYEV